MIVYKEIRSDFVVAEKSMVILASAANHVFQEISLLRGFADTFMDDVRDKLLRIR